MAARMIGTALMGLLLAAPVVAQDRLRANLRGVVVTGHMEGDFYARTGELLHVPLAGLPIHVQLSIRPGRLSGPNAMPQLIGLARITLNNGALLVPQLRFADQLRGGFTGDVPLGFCCLPGETATGATSLTSSVLPGGLRHDVRLDAYSDLRNVGHGLDLRLIDAGAGIVAGGSGRFGESYWHGEYWINRFEFTITSGSVSAAIPEPAGWLGMIAGLALTGMMLRGHQCRSRQIKLPHGPLPSREVLAT